MTLNTNCCTSSIYNKGVDTANWIKTNSKAAAASAGATFSKVRDCVAAFFASVGQTLKSGWNVAKNNVIAAAKYVAATSPTTKACGAFALVALAAFIVYNQMNPSVTTGVKTTTKPEANGSGVTQISMKNPGDASQPQSPRQPQSPAAVTVATVQLTDSDKV